MPETTHRSAVAILPPTACWPPIEAIRAVHDRRFRRWMPHINLIYPFAPEHLLPGLAGRLAATAAAIAPFPVRLERFGLFRHRQGRCTLWLAPEPATALVRLQAALAQAAPGYGERRPGTFRPHLSVGQAPAGRAETLLAALQADWQPLAFTVTEISIICRGEPPEDRFRVSRLIRLGGPA
ncbi:2'-5' RNA ligase family protein [Thioalbus denitrificans]|uniref:2'-5' RNA ligase n=1 Tax=Thioalbus denitrificans TaxID=547122 RepID=A0A369CFQ4_9GAMM|nr:2'-5' RNA ligase family protein [Thioalbus denitrificans]RCX32880.1 2'-5' RNA ligase [Thioalbus denitrificans]